MKATIFRLSTQLVKKIYATLGLIYLTGAEKYDPISGTWIVTSSLHAERSVYTATLLDDGRLLVAGGFDGINVIDSVELY